MSQKRELSKAERRREGISNADMINENCWKW